MSKEKKHHELLEFFADVVRADDDARLLMVGDGPDRAELEQQAAQAPLSGHVIFTGMIPQEELYRYYKSGIAFLSASDFEMHSLTYLESIACGVPLICRKDPCLEGVLENEYDGFAWETKEEFVSACVRLMKDRELQKQMSEAALERADCFDEKTCAKRMLELYERVR